MATEMLSYSQLGDRLSCSPEAARALVKRLRLPRQKANDGKVLVSVDLTEINHKPMSVRSPAGHQPIITSLKARIQDLESELGKVETELGKVEASAANHRADFERERERFDRLMAEQLRTTLDAMTAKEAAARLEGELAVLRSRPWWRRLVA
jgi:capsule polysaccharide export protein KpsE/RkpR